MAYPRSSIALLSLGSLGATCAVMAGAAPPHGGGTTPPPDPAIAYADSGIKVMNADGSNQRTLVSLRRGEDARAPAWSPDSTQVAYWGRQGGGTGIWAVPVAGGASHLVTTTLDTSLPAWPDWSPVPTPDGHHKIVYSDLGTVSGDRDLFLVNPDGSGKVRLTATTDSYEANATWAPDGRRLIVCDLYSFELVILDLDLVNSSLAVVGRTVVYGGDNPPAFPRWGKASEQITFAVPLSMLGPLRVVTLDLTDPLAIPIVLTSSPNADERWSSFSPDDSRLVLHRSGSSGGIFTINADGTGETRINSRGSDPNWRRTP